MKEVDFLCDQVSEQLDEIVTRRNFRCWHIAVANALAETLVALCSALNDKNYSATAQHVTDLVNRSLVALQKKPKKRKKT